MRVFLFLECRLTLLLDQSYNPAPALMWDLSSKVAPRMSSPK